MVTPDYNDPEEARKFVTAAAGLEMGRRPLMRILEQKDAGALPDVLTLFTGEAVVELAQALRAELHRQQPEVW